MAASVAAAITDAAEHHRIRTALLLGALGVVFGDIGTGPIYAFRESLRAAGNAAAPETVLGVLSMVFWAVVLVIAVKYVLFVMRADNHGEGGILSLLALVRPVAGKARNALLIVGLCGAALFFGDAMITPAISVLSAIEGLEIAAPSLQPYVAPIAAVVLVALFAIQHRGSGVVGGWFGPVMVVWFAVIALSGCLQIARRPEVLAALNPVYAAAYVGHAGWTAFDVLGSVFLALTGGEALYADMGHFGRGAIRLDWFAAVMPALALNYFGQGALVLSGVKGAAENPFFLLFPGGLLVPAVLLATAATIIASQAVISGAFTLSRQAMQFGVLPRLDVRQTSDESAGQIYVPQLNWLLAIAVLALVFGFRSSDALASAYGIAVAGTMLVTTILVSVVAHRVWRWPTAAVLPIAGLFLVVDLVFVSANLHKIAAGGWFPLLIGALTLTLMLCWRRGRRIALARREADAVPLGDFIASLDMPGAPMRMRGAAVYLTTQADTVPSALALNVKHNGVVHEHVLLLRVLTDNAPRVEETSRIRVEALSHGFRRVELRFGFAEKPDVPSALARHKEEIGCDPDVASFFLGREMPVPSLQPHLPRWQERIYAFLTRNAVSAPDYFMIPPARVVELGTNVEM